MYDLTQVQGDALLEVLAALSLCNLPPALQHAATAMQAASAMQQQQPPVGQERVFAHELSMLLLAQLFSREAQRPDNVEYWPENNAAVTTTAAAAGQGSSPPLLDGMMSPTRHGLGAGKSLSGGRSAMRQQLQQHLRNQHSALRGYGDYLRCGPAVPGLEWACRHRRMGRNVKGLLEGCCLSWP